jgi:hypothetical protein
MSRVTMFVSLLGLLAAGAPVEKAAAAAPVPGYTGQVPSSVAGCPNLMWRLARRDNGDVTGIFYYSDMSGVSEVKGTIDQAGHFQLTMTSAMGQGPVGTVTGTKSRNGAVNATMTGDGCANAQLHFRPVLNLTNYNATPNAH